MALQLPPAWHRPDGLLVRGCCGLLLRTAQELLGLLAAFAAKSAHTKVACVTYTVAGQQTPSGSAVQVWIVTLLCADKNTDCVTP